MEETDRRSDWRGVLRGPGGHRENERHGWEGKRGRPQALGGEIIGGWGRGVDRMAGGEGVEAAAGRWATQPGLLQQPEPRAGAKMWAGLAWWGGWSLDSRLCCREKLQSQPEADGPSFPVFLCSRLSLPSYHWENLFQASQRECATILCWLERRVRVRGARGWHLQSRINYMPDIGWTTEQRVSWHTGFMDRKVRLRMRRWEILHVSELMSGRTELHYPFLDISWTSGLVMWPGLPVPESQGPLLGPLLSFYSPSSYLSLFPTLHSHICPPQPTHVLTVTSRHFLDRCFSLHFLRDSPSKSLQLTRVCYKLTEYRPPNVLIKLVQEEFLEAINKTWQLQERKWNRTVKTQKCEEPMPTSRCRYRDVTEGNSRHSWSPEKNGSKSTLPPESFYKGRLLQFCEYYNWSVL